MVSHPPGWPGPLCLLFLTLPVASHHFMLHVLLASSPEAFLGC